MIPYIQKPNKVIVKLYNTDNSFIESIIIPTERYPVNTNFQCFDYSNTEKINDKHILDIFDSIDFEFDFDFDFEYQNYLNYLALIVQHL